MTTRYEIHPAANVMPEMPDKEYQELKADIEAHGLLTMIEIAEGKIIDGRHRYRACQELGIELTVDNFWEVDLEGMTAGQYVWSLNGNRRHLTESQRSACFYELVGREAEEKAKQRQKDAGGDKKALVAKLPEALGSTRSRDEVAKAAGVSPRTVQDAATVAKKDPELFQEVKEGKVSASAAAKQVRDREKPDKPAEEKNRVLGPPPEVAAVLRAWGKLESGRMVAMREMIATLAPAELTIVTDFLSDAIEARSNA